MQLLVVTLDDSEEFLRTLSKLKEQNMNGIVLPSTSLKHALLSQNAVDDVPIFGSVSKIVRHEFEASHTLLMLVEENQLEAAKKTVRDITRGLGKKGVMFALPVSFWEGIDL